MRRSATCNIGEILIDQGRLDEAEAMFRETLRVFKASGVRAVEVFVATLLAATASRSGRFEEADRDLRSGRSAQPRGRRRLAQRGRGGAEGRIARSAGPAARGDRGHRRGVEVTARDPSPRAVVASNPRLRAGPAARTAGRLEALERSIAAARGLGASTTLRSPWRRSCARPHRRSIRPTRCAVSGTNCSTASASSRVPDVPLPAELGRNRGGRRDHRARPRWSRCDRSATVLADRVGSLDPQDACGGSAGSSRGGMTDCVDAGNRSVGSWFSPLGIAVAERHGGAGVFRGRGALQNGNGPVIRGSCIVSSKANLRPEPLPSGGIDRHRARDRADAVALQLVGLDDERRPRQGRSPSPRVGKVAVQSLVQSESVLVIANVSLSDRRDRSDGGSSAVYPELVGVDLQVRERSRRPSRRSSVRVPLRAAVPGGLAPSVRATLAPGTGLPPLSVTIEGRVEV